MNTIYTHIVQCKQVQKKLLVILIDPDKICVNNIENTAKNINVSGATHIFVGGSIVTTNLMDTIIKALKKFTTLPILLFPGNSSQISKEADGILFLNLVSGRNPDYLIEHQVNAVPYIEKTTLEVIPTGYLLIESGLQTAVERVSQTKPMDRKNINYVCQTAKAAEYMGNKLIYLEAGSGADNPILPEMITKVAKKINIPLIVGGGIKTKKAIETAFEAGADIVVIGTAFENDINFFKK